VRPEPSIHAKAYVNNEEMGYDLPLDWTTFPDRLEKHGISWRIYQNEISLPTGLSDEANSWLSNFDDNPLDILCSTTCASPARTGAIWLRKRSRFLLNCQP
jgi:phospholipase C